MSFTDRHVLAGRHRPALPVDTIALVGVLVLAVLAMIFLATGRGQEIRRSPVGLNGLSMWLQSADMDVQIFNGGWTIPVDEVGLNIVPVYDTALDASRALPTSKEELILQRDEYDLEAAVLRDKAMKAPTLLVLPKWRSGMRLTGLAHPILLIEGRASGRILQDSFPDAAFGRIRHIPSVETEFDYVSGDGKRHKANLYVAQVFEGNGCEALIGAPGAMVLGRCQLQTEEGAYSLHILADPDLLNNHGLRLGDNAMIAHDFIADLAGDKRVLVDYSRENWLVEAQTYTHPDRTWADLARFFAYPFSLLWIGAGLTLVLFIWRGSLRVGPIVDGAMGLSASKAVMIGSRARLMRLTGQDGALLRDYADIRVATILDQVLGAPQTAHGSDALLRYAEQRDPRLAAGLDNTLSRIQALPAHITAEAAVDYVDELETLLEQLSDDT